MIERSADTCITYILNFARIQWKIADQVEPVQQKGALSKNVKEFVLK